MKTDISANKNGNEAEQEEFWRLYGAYDKRLKLLWDLLENSKGERTSLLPLMKKVISGLAEIDLEEAESKARYYASKAKDVRRRHENELSDYCRGGTRYYPTKEDIAKEKRIKKEYPQVIEAFERISWEFKNIEFSIECTQILKLVESDSTKALKQASSHGNKFFTEIFDHVAEKDPAIAFKVAADILKYSSSYTNTSCVPAVFDKFVELAALRPDLLKADKAGNGFAP